jgi:hypothetical protein
LSFLISSVFSVSPTLILNEWGFLDEVSFAAEYPTWSMEFQMILAGD